MNKPIRYKRLKWINQSDTKDCNINITKCYMYCTAADITTQFTCSMIIILLLLLLYYYYDRSRIITTHSLDNKVFIIE